jgi:hypothetical protein
MNNGGRDCGNLSVREVARLSQNQDARRHTLNFTLPGKVHVVLRQECQRTLIDNVTLINRVVRGGPQVDHE